MDTGRRSDEKPQEPGAATAGASSPVPGDVENPSSACDLGNCRDRDQEYQDRADLRRKIQEGSDIHRMLVSRVHGWPGRVGLVSVVSKRWATTRCRVFALLASTPDWHRCRATRPRVCLAMCVAPGTRICTQRLARGPWGTQAAAYVLERVSTIIPRPASSGRTLARGARHTAASGPRSPRFTPIERRYGGILSAGRRAPNKAETTTSQRLARRRAAESIEARSSASYRTPV